jgi:hypothetical protein
MSILKQRCALTPIVKITLVRVHTQYIVNKKKPVGVGTCAPLPLQVEALQATGLSWRYRTTGVTRTTATQEALL